MFIHKIQYHKTLNPKIWLPDNTMDPVVRRVIIAVASDFIDFMHSVGFQVTRKDILDIVIYGSNANYFYDKHSDIDVYVLMDLDAVQEKYKGIDFFSVYLSLFHTWRRQYKLRIRGLRIDLVLKNVNQSAHVPGWRCPGAEYSVIHNKWIHEAVLLDKKTFREYHRLAHIQVRAVLNDARKLIAYNGPLDKFVYRQLKLRDDAMCKNWAQPLVPETMAYKMLRGSGLFAQILKTASRRRAVVQFGVD